MDYSGRLQHHPLFSGMEREEIRQVLSLLHVQEKQYQREEYIYMEGDRIRQVGVILDGVVLMEKNDPYGNSYFFTQFRELDIFGDPFISTHILASTVNYRAQTDCTILFFPYQQIWSTGSGRSAGLPIFTRNLMGLLALKTRSLLVKIEILSCRSIRERVLTFLTIIKQSPFSVLHSRQHQPEDLSPNQVFIPYNHTELAEYLGVNRSALVRELGRMRQEGILSCNKNIYTVMDKNQNQ